MQELKYYQLEEGLTEYFPYAFQMGLCIGCDDAIFDKTRDAVIPWCEERFGEGVISMSDKLWRDQAPTGAVGIAASCAWVMTMNDVVAFQNVDHALEFKFRWC